MTSLHVPKSGVRPGPDGARRCWWCLGDPIYLDYHDNEWGRPTANDTRLFEQLALEGFQAGLSWLTILRKREGFRRAFEHFDVGAVARFSSRSVERLLNDSDIVRHRGKIEATIDNARRCLDLVDEVGSFARFVWDFAPDQRGTAAPSNWDALVTKEVSPEAIALSKELRRRGWSFVGPTTVYSFMEAVGMVNDHLKGCALRQEVEEHRSGFDIRA